MGMDLTVTFGGDVPAWQAVHDLLVGRGFPVQVRMIDGELAFPHEQPPEGWRELRVAGPAGSMVTVRREPGRVVLVVWGNADAASRQAWHALAWAFAEAGGGVVQTSLGPASAADFHRTMEVPDALRPESSE